MNATFPGFEFRTVPSTHTISAWDGLKLHVREWHGGDRLPPVLCLPGLVRTGADFETLTPAIIEGRRVVTIDYPGRGDSGRSPDVTRYAPEACLRDVMDACAALHIHHAVVIGTSFGGLLAMGLAAARPGLVRAVILNDVGPDIGSRGAEFVRDFVGKDPAFENLDACVTFLRTNLPPMSLNTDAGWRRMAELTYQPGQDGRFHPLWDTRIAQLLNRPAPDLWPLFGAVPRACPADSRCCQQHTLARYRHAYAGDSPGHDGRHAARHRPRPDPDRTARARRDPGLSGATHMRPPA
jgi:pimeloyl-ACP methyl ester carboxylesterase